MTEHMVLEFGKGGCSEFVLVKMFGVNPGSRWWDWIELPEVAQLNTDSWG